MFPFHRKRPSAPAKARQLGSRRRLLVESLEERRVMAISAVGLVSDVPSEFGPSDAISIQANFTAEDLASVSGDEAVSVEWSLYYDDGVIVGGEAPNFNLDIGVPVELGTNDTLLATLGDAVPYSFEDNEATPIAPFELSYEDVDDLLGNPADGQSFSMLVVGKFTNGEEVRYESVAFTITIAPVEADNVFVVDGQLNVIAQPGGSTVVITGGANGTTVSYDGETETFADVESILVTGGAGNDVIIVSGVSAPVTILAGEGNDIIAGGSGSDVLVGGLGNDVIIGGAGSDLIIGGNGADILLGNGGDDILISGYTNFDSNAVTLSVLLGFWNTLPTSTRIADLGTLGLNSSNVFDDDALDLVAGNAGTDWFFANLILDGTGDRRDMILGRAAGEGLVEL